VIVRFFHFQLNIQLVLRIIGLLNLYLLLRFRGHFLFAAANKVILINIFQAI
jgi:hypothetical protein